MMTDTIFENENSQVVGQPKECRFDADKWTSFMQSFDLFSDDLFQDGRADVPSKEREQL